MFVQSHYFFGLRLYRSFSFLFVIYQLHVQWKRCVLPVYSIVGALNGGGGAGILRNGHVPCH